MTVGAHSTLQDDTDTGVRTACDALDEPWRNGKKIAAIISIAMARWSITADIKAVARFATLRSNTEKHKSQLRGWNDLLVSSLVQNSPMVQGSRPVPGL